MKIQNRFNQSESHQQPTAGQYLFQGKQILYIVNTGHISSLNNNDIQIGRHEIPVGNTYRNAFFERYVSGKLLN
jgi:hypothetical protein